MNGDAHPGNSSQHRFDGAVGAKKVVPKPRMESPSGAKNEPVSAPVPPPLPAQCRSPRESLRRVVAPPIHTSWRHRAAENVSSSWSLNHLQIDTNLSAFHVKEESTGWVSSVALHAALALLLVMLLAPADFGGIEAHKLLVTLDHQSETEEDVTFDTSLFDDDEELSQEIEVDPIEPIVVDALPDAALEAAPAKEARSRKSGASGGQAAARGSFFGIDAYGHTFVYVLDMSGSMKGRRFRRASAELVRSVGELSEDQKFYVLLFGSITVQMFDQNDLQPTPVAATRENKERLSQWLQTAFRGGNTDPRQALVVSLRMKPSAIYMLSDGKFNGKNKQRRSRLFAGNSDAFAIVAKEGSDVPIHAIAFENLQSCANMKRLAQMTNGQYRFAAANDGKQAQESLAVARAAVDRGDVATGEILMREIIEVQGESDAGRQAKATLAALHLRAAEDALKEQDHPKLRDALIEIINLDPQAKVTEVMQMGLMQKLLEPGSDEARTKQRQSLLDELVKRFPRSALAQKLLGPVSEGLLDDARTLASVDPVVAIEKLEVLQQRYPLTPAAEQSQGLRQQLIDELWEQVNEHRESGNAVAAVKMLRRINASAGNSELGSIATRELSELAGQMMAEVRSAGIANDLKRENEARREIEEAFGNDDTLRKIQRAFTQNEVRARDLLRRGDRMKRSGSFDNAVAKYKAILKEYPQTVTAKTAQSRLQEMGRDEGPVSEDEALMLELMRQ